MSRNWQLFSYFTLVFVAGLGVGVMGQRLYYSTGTVAATGDRPKNPEDFRKMYMSEMKSRLKMSDDQMQKLVVVLDETHQRYKEARERHRPDFVAIQEKQVAQITAFLSEEQRSEYSKMRAEREARKKKMDQDRGARR